MDEGINRMLLACGMKSMTLPRGPLIWKPGEEPCAFKGTDFPGVKITGTGIRSQLGEPMVFTYVAEGPPDQIAAMTKKLEEMGMRWDGERWIKA